MRACPLARGTGCSRASPAPAAARAVHPAPRRCVATRAAALEKEVVDSSSISPYLRVSILSEALPYLQKFRGKTVVIKYGGAAMKDEKLKDRVVSDVVLLSTVGIRPVLVHGGGPEINSWLGKLGIAANFKNGLRVTDGPTMEVVEMVLVGKVNKSIVTLINQAGGSAVGMCGKDGRLLVARQMVEEELGFVGEVTSVNPTVLKNIMQDNTIPVIATVAQDHTGQALNVNADTAAGEIAAAVGAEKLILMTDVPGVMRNKDDISTLFRSLTIREARELIKDGVIAGGMIPKVQCCVRSLSQGIGAAHIIDGRQPHSLLQELLTDSGVGTMITG